MKNRIICRISAYKAMTKVIGEVIASEIMINVLKKEFEK